MPERLVCLLPVRNAAADLPGFFASVGRFCDAIVALDDGSTDETRALLEAEPLVQVVLANPRRPDYRGWDDAANRNRTLAAAAALDPSWLISLDADERIDAADAAALRAFLETDALPGCAYGFRHVPMRGGPDQFLPRYQWIYRLFASEPGQRFPSQRLHFIPIPTSIPRQRWIRTSIRVQHLGGMTAERRLSRFSKYLEADPDRLYQNDYTHLLTNPDPTTLRDWTPRSPDLPVLLAPTDPDADGELIAEDAVSGTVALSAIVIAQHNAATIRRTVASIVHQACPEPFETIVVVSGSPETAAIVRRDFPDVTLVELPHPVYPGAARNEGLKLARGRYISFPGSHVELPPGSLAARLAAHERGYAMVTGITHNGNTSRAGWASYFLDHHAGLPGHAATELNGPPAHCSYARLPLLDVGGFPGDVRTGEDTAVNRALVQRGYVAFRAPTVALTHRSPCRTPKHLIRHHVARGRGWGRLVLAHRRDTGPVLTRDLIRSRGVTHLTTRLRRIATDVAGADAALTPPYRAVRPLIRLGAGAAWAGMWWEIVRPSPGKLNALVGRPVRTLLVATTDAGRPPSITILRLDVPNGLAQTIPLPPDLPVRDATNATVPLAEAFARTITSRPPGRLDRIRVMIVGAVHLRIRVMIVGAVHLPIDDVIVGAAADLARLLGPVVDVPGSSSSAPPGAVGAGDLDSPMPTSRLRSLRIWADAVSRIPSVSTSLSAWDLGIIATGIRRLTPLRVSPFAPSVQRRPKPPVDDRSDPSSASWMP